jgi:alkanesulfonate monooxygenase SsuD/methylene tetrahydromethanopterin reductase-like flavin-dependent oxidoreductase (luciferase family)
VFAAGSRLDADQALGTFVVVGETDAEAREKRPKLDSLVRYESALDSLSIALGHDVSGFDPDAPLPEIPDSNASSLLARRARRSPVRIRRSGREQRTPEAPRTSEPGG